MRIIATSLALLSFAALLPSSAEADRRVFGHVYPYKTLPRGTLELEHYLDLGFNGWDDSATPAEESAWHEVDWKHQVEFEYGITDRLDFGFYNVFRQKPFGGLTYDGVKLRSRYRFGEQGDLFIDPAIYLEVGYSGGSVKLEQMVILSKILGRFEVAFNLKAEQALELKDKIWELELFPLFGIGYHINNHLAVGVEHYGKLKVEDGEVDYYASYLGPAISVAGGPFYWTVAAQPQLGGRKSIAAVQVRSLFGAVF